MKSSTVLQDDNAQLCVYVQGELVVDLWSQRDGFSADSLVNIFSSSKSITAIALASMVGAGLLNYEDRISQHWPEFSAEGKSEVTLEQLLRSSSVSSLSYWTVLIQTRGWTSLPGELCPQVQPPHHQHKGEPAGEDPGG